MSDNTALIAALKRKAKFFQRFVGMGENETEILLLSAADALTKAERELTELGTAFRDYKIVHPEGTEDLHRKLAGQAATLAAIREWRSTTLWAQPNWASLKVILDPPEGTR